MSDGSPTVLVVDDEEDVVRVYELALAERYDVRTAASGPEALDELDETVDVVLLDRRMPGTSGSEVLEEIRERDVEVRVAMVTAVDPAFDVVEMPFDAYVTKPVDDEDLRETVADLLALAEHDDRARERFAVARKRAVLEAEMSQRRLADSDEYAALCERAAELDAETSAAMDAETFEQVLTGAPFDDGGSDAGAPERREP